MPVAGAAYCRGMADVRAMNRSMVERLLAEPGTPPDEGGYTLRVVETRGRCTGEPRRTPLALVRHQGEDYLVTPDPHRDWARNLRATPAAVVRSGDGAVSVEAVPVGPDEGAPVVHAYLAAMTVPWAREAFPVGADDPLDTVREHMGSISVFRLLGR